MKEKLVEIADNIINWGVTEIEIPEHERTIYLYVSWDKEKGFQISGEQCKYSHTIPPSYIQPSEDVWIWKDIVEYEDKKATIFQTVAEDYGFNYDKAKFS